MTFYEREIERIKREHGLCEDQGVQAHRILRDERHHRSMRVRARVVDCTDAELFPNIAEAARFQDSDPQRWRRLNAEWVNGGTEVAND